MLILVELVEVAKSNEALRNIRAISCVRSASLVTDKQVVSAGYHRPVCPDCHHEMGSVNNDTVVLDITDNGPYALWASDLWACSKCGKRVSGGFGNSPIQEHFEPGFQKTIDRYREMGLLIKNHCS